MKMTTQELALHFSYFIHDAYMKIKPLEFLNITTSSYCSNITELLRRSKVLTKIVKNEIERKAEISEYFSDIIYKLFAMKNYEAALAVMKGIPRELSYSSTKYDTLFGKDTDALMLKVVTNNIIPVLDYKDNFIQFNNRFFTSHIKNPSFCIPVIEHAMINIQQCQIARNSFVYSSSTEVAPLLCFDKVWRLYNIAYNYLRFQLDNPIDYSTVSLDVMLTKGTSLYCNNHYIVF